MKNNLLTCCEILKGCATWGFKILLTEILPHEFENSHQLKLIFLKYLLRDNDVKPK